MKKSLKINRAVANRLQKWMDANKPIPDAGEDEVVMTYTVHFTKTIEADVKVCNGNNGPWIDAVLFHNSHEICTLEPSYTIIGEYRFRNGCEEYILELK